MSKTGHRKRDIKPVSFLWRDYEGEYLPVIGTVFPDGRVECLYGMDDWIEDKESNSLPYLMQDPKLNDE